MMKIRQAKSSDKKEILGFCTNTFSWGDYIDQVWDYWFSDKNGRLFVAEDEGKKIGVSHVAICPGSRAAWLEGVRVHPQYRRSKIATALLNTMLAFAGKKGARQASAIVSSGNIPSQHMMEKNGFAEVSRWVYYSTDQKFEEEETEARLARLADLERIWSYLIQKSRIYQLSAGTYVKAWHWYPLDKGTLQKLIREKSIAVTGSGDIDGVIIINAKGYWKRTNVLQIVYLDSESKKALKDLLALAINVYSKGGYINMHIVCYNSKSITNMLKSFRKEENSELFLLYRKNFT
jgi:N-acetylglutamate synthase-like GNAT family acetyltransferase